MCVLQNLSLLKCAKRNHLFFYSLRSMLQYNCICWKMPHKTTPRWWHYWATYGYYECGSAAITSVLRKITSSCNPSLSLCMIGLLCDNTPKNENFVSSKFALSTFSLRNCITIQWKSMFPDENVSITICPNQCMSIGDAIVSVYSHVHVLLWRLYRVLSVSGHPCLNVPYPDTVAVFYHNT